MKKYFSRLALAAIISLPLAAHSVDAKRQAEVAKRGPDVMPFSLKATTHFFTKTNNGGTQRVKANPDLASAIEKFWFYDLRAKAADDTSDKRDEQAASNLLGHESVKTTQRHHLRRGRIVPPTK
jgi:integrase